MKKSHKPSSLFHTFNNAFFQIKVLIGIACLFLIGNSAFAAASCPSGQRLYYVGAAAPTTAYKSLPLSSWVEGSVTRTYTFSEASGNKSLTINFPLFLDKYTTFSSQPPYYGSLNGATLNAITMIHNSTQTRINHTMDVTVNTPVTRFGYVIQDIDSARDGSGNVPYQEAVNVSSTSGTLTYQSASHTINPSLDMVTSIRQVFCNGDSSNYACPIEATWGPKAANSPFSLTHSNEFSQYNGAHVLGYSDFYFCLAPPRLTVSKQLSGTRVNDSSSNRDQFIISVNNGANSLTSFETTGSGQTVANASNAISLAENTTYTITEKVTSSATGDIANYNASYSCTNSTTNSTTVMPSSAMTYNASTKTRSFTLSNVAYGDDISCTIVNSPKSVFDPGSSLAPATCPTDHRMYYLGASPPNSAYKSQSLTDWTAGTDSKIYSFNEPSGNKTFTISFASIVDKYTTYNEQSPFYGSIPDATQNAINVIHSSPAAKSNHTLNVIVNKPVSKLGYVIQDLDSNSDNNQVAYQEQADVSGSLGTLNAQPTYHTINGSNTIVTSIRGINCQTANSCPINATWGYKATNSPFSLVHNNIFSQYDSPHAVAYSDFYFCMAPPKVVINKQLTGNRVNDTASNRDQFSISINNGTSVVGSFETTGSGQTITNGSSNAISLSEGISYTITEKIINSLNNGDAANYTSTYTCSNNTTGSSTVMPTTAMTYNTATKTRSFTLANVNYGDEITCTIVNSPANYTFSGIVFNDNGGIVASDNTRLDISSTFTGNSSYFNGIYESASEAGIYDSNLSISLTDCNGNNIVTTSANPQAVSNISTTRGRYSFTVAASALSNKTKVCVIENEPTTWDYTIDTNVNNREVTLVGNVYDYSNLDFGEVKANNAALVLVKSQYVHECNNNLDYQAISNNEADPTVGFSTNPISGTSPGKCIAYSVKAYNRGHVGLQQVQILDQLQVTPVTSIFRQPAPLFIPTSITSPTVSYGNNGEIRSNPFSLAAAPSSGSQPSSAILYFNTKYGSIQ